ncbi:hypothetical protein F5X97DRAFT_310665 [Nemania serpens]|nr:hypothetical protein F5X97DRAFT_310665 [Nemania serpens]
MALKNILNRALQAVAVMLVLFADYILNFVCRSHNCCQSMHPVHRTTRLGRELASSSDTTSSIPKSKLFPIPWHRHLLYLIEQVITLKHKLT